MKRTLQHYLFSFSLIAALLLDMSGSFANGCAVNGPSGCCCCDAVDETDGQCCCDDSDVAKVCACGCSSPQTPVVPPVRQADDSRSDYQRTVIIKLELPVEEGSLRCGNIEDSSLTFLLCPTRRRAILCCWIT